jgi:YYY domain-containing protein
MVDAAISKPKKESTWLYDFLLIVVLLLGAYFRLTGSDWGQLNIQHPDENFMTSVTLGIQPVHSMAEYFNTARSTLNPSVVGYPAYVYGTLPLFIVHYLAEWFGKLNSVTLFGRQLSALSDLGTIALLYFIVKRFYKPWVALLGAMFSALAVMQIQQSHFYTTDNFYTFFMFLTLYIASVIATGGGNCGQSSRIQRAAGEPGMQAKETLFGTHVWHSLLQLIYDPLTYLTIAFGVSLGMSAASKLNAVAMAVVLPFALLLRYYNLAPQKLIHVSGSQRGMVDRTPVEDFLAKTFVFLMIGAIVSLLAFRIFQPYAFTGPGFFDFRLNPEWVQKIREQLLQASPNADMPWALQWARRNHLYSFQNLTVWGLGLPLGILSWVGFLWMGWRILKGEWRQHTLLWSWTAVYFFWQSMQYNPNMRYQLPIYPLLAMMAAWVVFEWARSGLGGLERFKWRTFLAAMVGVSVLTGTAMYAYGFSRIYVRPETRIAASNWIYQNIPGPINLQVKTVDGTLNNQPLPFPTSAVVQADNPYRMVFVSQSNGLLTSILFGHIADTSKSGAQTLSVILSTASEPQPQEVLADLAVTADFSPTEDKRGIPMQLVLDDPIIVQRGVSYFLKLETTGGTLTLVGSAVANETDYDYPLPFRTASYDAFGGIYPGGLNLQVYWDDNADKLGRLKSVLDQADYIFIPTNHQYTQITRLPERYPLTTEYYRQLVGCPLDKNIIWCYRVAEPGSFQGNLGFDLVSVFESYIHIGPFVINDQTAEEAFTFYDHPKVLIFKKNSNYNPEIVRSILGKVDYSKAIHLTPGQADNYKSLMLSSDKLVVQQAGGTWSELFNRDALINRYPVLGLLLWYLVIFVLGLFTYPLVRAAFPGLSDHGYPLARIVGLLLWAWLAWMAGSIGLSYNKLTIGVALGLILLMGVWQLWRQRLDLLQEFRERWKYFLMVEVIFLGFFLLDLFIRIGNPDLWHDPDGGERPMDFAYFNAVLKSTTFPPYDPWFAGGYINYYYYGYVIVGTPVKLLGIVPAIAYNFILPTLFACLALGAFSVGWNMLANGQIVKHSKWRMLLGQKSFITGISASAALILLGNLGTIRLLYRGFMCLAAPVNQLGSYNSHDCIIAPGVLPIDQVNIFLRLWWTIKGFFLSLGGLNLPLSNREWMMTPSRALPGISGDPITEFPLFTFLWSDLHAHMIAFSVTVLAISWTLSVLLAKGRWRNRLDVFLGLFLGGLTIGALRPTNTWDFYTYLILGSVTLAYVVWRYSDQSMIYSPLPVWGKRFLLTLGAVLALGGLSTLLYLPFTQWFAQAYNTVELWKGSRSDISSYLVHWGTFLFIIVSWMVWETRQWLAITPVSALQKIRPYRDFIITAIVIIMIILVAQQIWVMNPGQNVPFKKITILWLATPLSIWAGILLLRPGISDAKRLVLFMTGTSLLLTMVVEIIVLRGDVGRMNTVFKFYLEAWTMLGISAAVAFGWLLSDFRKWLPAWRTFWMVSTVLLVSGSVYYLFSAGMAKIRDRMNPSAPHTFDSMTYIAYFPPYYEFNTSMDLSEDYRAIRWMQERIIGSPVIVEAAPAGVQYTWLSRYSIYTGLPAVVGWQWHQQQQRVLFSGDVITRGKEVDMFYTTTDMMVVRDFLKKYDVRYIILGQLERAKYAPGALNGPAMENASDGLLKFDANNYKLWREVYHEGRTVIYEVLEGSEVSAMGESNP